SHKAMEFTGDAIRSLGMDDRFTMCNMAIEAGAKNGIMEVDMATRKYVKKAIRENNPKRKKFKEYFSDKDAVYCERKEYDVSDIDPVVAMPHLPSNVMPAHKIKDIKIDQVVIGSCTNGRISDLRLAAKVLKGKKIKPWVRLIVIPATQAIYTEAAEEGLAKIFVESGGVFSTPSCGPCLGGHLGILAEGERAIASTNRNFVGRMGHPKSEVYLANPAVCAASAVKGKICHPEDVV
ncbi:MAG: 3-isopropylmalate dehydratase large subunit, partial [Candidatus Omnitrophica bacterium]|nr:3-isopropylmalate dehydratase large subunit [Candidatus Omnitrophota bacterium]